MSLASARTQDYHTGASLAGSPQPPIRARAPEIAAVTISQTLATSQLTPNRSTQHGHIGEEALSPVPPVSSEQVESVNEVIMAIYVGERSSMGCAYFSTADATLHMSEDISMATLDIADQFMNHIEPTTLLVSARAPRFILDFFETKVEPRPGCLPTL